MSWRFIAPWEVSCGTSAPSSAQAGTCAAHDSCSPLGGGTKSPALEPPRQVTRGGDIVRGAKRRPPTRDARIGDHQVMRIVEYAVCTQRDGDDPEGGSEPERGGDEEGATEERF